MALDQLNGGESPASARSKINAGLVEADKVAGLSAAVASHGQSLTAVAASVNGLANSASATADILDDLALTKADEATVDERIGGIYASLAGKASKAGVSALSDEIDGLAEAKAEKATLDERRYEFMQPPARPGEAPTSFFMVSTFSAAAGQDAALPIISPANIAFGDSGTACRVRGPAIVGMRRAAAIEPGRVYRPRFVVQRRSNASDPSDDTVRAAIVWLDQARNVLPGADGLAVVKDWTTLIVNDGRQEVQTTLARAPGQDVLVMAPKRARYARAIVWCFGLDAVTDVEVLTIDDVTLATVLDPVSTDTTARVTALETQDLGPRLSAVESQLGTPNSLTFATRGTAAASTIPETVTTVELRGRDTPGDGFAGLYKRIAGVLPEGADGFVSGGAAWMRVPTAQEAFNAAFTPLFVGWMAALPTNPPAAPLTAWNNGGIPAVSGAAP